MKQVRFEIAFADAHWTSIESDWIDLSPDREDGQLKSFIDGIEDMLNSEHGFISFPVDDIMTFYSGKHIVSVKLATQTVE